MKKQEVFVFPTSYAQQRLWFLDQLIPGNAAYNISRSIPWRGCLEVKALETSLNEMARRHESLRTCFGTKEGEPFQVILPAMSLPLSVVNLQARPAPTRRAEARRLAQEEAQRPFDLARAPLLRPTLMLLQEEYSLFLLTMHHLISDRWSMQVFFRELTELYYALVDHRPFPLPDSPIQYADFAVWQRQWLHGERFTSQLNYWKQKLAGSPGVLQLPTDRPRPAVQAFQGECQSRLLPQGLTEPLRALGQHEGATLFMTMLAAFKVLLHRYTDQTDILVGSPIANRTRTELEGLIGFFVNTLVLRTDLSGDPTFRELLQRVRQTALEAFAHQDLPFERAGGRVESRSALGLQPAGANLIRVSKFAERGAVGFRRRSCFGPCAIVEYVLGRWRRNL